MELLITLLVFVVGMAWLGIVFFGPPYVPTHVKQLRVLFDELQLANNDHVVDLGAGDGRVLKLAAQKGAKVSGVELNPFLVWVARWRLRRTPRAQVELGDIWHYSLPSDTTYVFVFFAHTFMQRLERYIVAQKRPVTVISYGFSFEDRTSSRVVGAFNIYEF